jgi:serine/threonine-protein kinase
VSSVKCSNFDSVSVLAGGVSAAFADGLASLARFNSPEGVALDGSGNLYIADTSNHRLRKVTPAGFVTTFAGSGAASSVDGTGSQASFNSPRSVVIDASSVIYVGTASNIRKVTPVGVVTTLAGASVASYADGGGSNARFDSVYGLALDGFGNIMAADTVNHRIRKVTAAGGTQLTWFAHGVILVGL